MYSIDTYMKRCILLLKNVYIIYEVIKFYCLLRKSSSDILFSARQVFLNPFQSDFDCASCCHVLPASHLISQLFTIIIY